MNIKRQKQETKICLGAGKSWATASHGIIYSIFQFLVPSELASAAAVCQLWRTDLSLALAGSAGVLLAESINGGSARCEN